MTGRATGVLEAPIAEAVILGAQLWAAAGATVAALFLLRGVGRLMPSAAGAWAFRPLILPGVVLLWPLVLWRWRVLARAPDAGMPGAGIPGAGTPRIERPPLRAQAIAAVLLAVAIPAVLVLGLAIRQDGPHEREAVLLEAPE